MANPEHEAKLKLGVDVWNQWRKETPWMRPDLSHATSLEKNLAGYDLSGTDLIESDLREANLRRARTQGANLYKADLRRATLIETDASFTCLTYASLQGADLSRVDFTSSDLRRANLTNARLGWAKLCDVDFSFAEGLDLVEHQGLSSLAVDTIMRSIPVLPTPFLRGVGIPDALINAILTLAVSEHRYPSCFIGYSSKDGDFANQLHENLRDKGVHCWYDRNDVKGGKRLDEQIDEGIRSFERFSLILSQHSMNSEFVKTEIGKAQEKAERESRGVFFPIRIVNMETIRKWVSFDAATGKDFASKIREYPISDFSDWRDPASYRKKLEQLLNDLKTEVTVERKPD
jgi:hypothetical protein